MKKFPFILICLFSITIPSIAQEITYEDGFFGYEFTRNGEGITEGEMVDIMEPYPQAHKLMKKAQVQNTFSYIFGISGIGLIGWGLIDKNNGDPNFGLVFSGIGASIVAVFFRSYRNQNSKQAVNIYNSKVHNSSSYQQSLNLHFNSNGIGLSFIF